MSQNAITVSTQVSVPLEKAWHYYTEAEHVINWNFASPDWHCPAAVNDLREGGDFKITMAAKDGSMKFDLEGTYDEVSPHRLIAYTLSNGRKVTVGFAKTDDGTEVEVQFEPEEGQDQEDQRSGWQGILDNYRSYTSGIQ